jgi:acyl carrier protein
MENFLIDKIEELAFTKVTKSEKLWESKILDSISIVELVVEIETEFSIKIPFNEIIVENFETIENMIQYIESKK